MCLLLSQNLLIGAKVFPLLLVGSKMVQLPSVRHSDELRYGFPQTLLFLRLFECLRDHEFIRGAISGATAHQAILAKVPFQEILLLKGPWTLRVILQKQLFEFFVKIEQAV